MCLLPVQPCACPKGKAALRAHAVAPDHKAQSPRKPAFIQSAPCACTCCCWAGVTCHISQIKVSEVSLDCLYSRYLRLDCLWTTYLPCHCCSDELGSLAITRGVLLADLPLLWTPWKQGPRHSVLTGSPSNTSPARTTCRKHLRKGSLLLQGYCVISALYSLH